MEVSRIRQTLKDEIAGADKVLIGIGEEWKAIGAKREEERARAAGCLKRMVDGKDFFIISTLTLEELLSCGFEKEHMVAPLDVSLTEEEWNGYMKWMGETLNRKTVLLELGEGFSYPTLIRWPFEKTAALNKKAYLYRVHEKFYQITDELKEKAVSVKMDSVKFMADWEGNDDGGN